MTQTIKLKSIELAVSNIQECENFYTTFVGMETISKSVNKVEIGSNGFPVVILSQETNFIRTSRNSSGLYHTALLFSKREDLADTVKNILISKPHLFHGVSNHIVSEAFYFTDPDGNGLELYFDKPKSEWEYDEKGELVMGSSYIDLENYLKTYGGVSNKSKDIQFGHIHLKVGNVNVAKDFYVNVLGFEIVTDMNSAVFVSKDKYHHHIGFNSWESAGSGKRNNNEYGLTGFTIEVVDKTYFDQILTNLKESKTEIKLTGDAIETCDPFGNRIIFLLIL